VSLRDVDADAVVLARTRVAGVLLLAVRTNETSAALALVPFLKQKQTTILLKRWSKKSYLRKFNKILLYLKNNELQGRVINLPLYFN